VTNQENRGDTRETRGSAVPVRLKSQKFLSKLKIQHTAGNYLSNISSLFRRQELKSITGGMVFNGHERNYTSALPPLFRPTEITIRIPMENSSAVLRQKTLCAHKPRSERTQGYCSSASQKQCSCGTYRALRKDQGSIRFFPLILRNKAQSHSGQEAKCILLFFAQPGLCATSFFTSVNACVHFC